MENQEISWTSDLDIAARSELDAWQLKKLSDLMAYIQQTKAQYGSGTKSRRFFLVTCTDTDGYHVRHPMAVANIDSTHSSGVCVEIHYVEVANNGAEVRIAPLYNKSALLPSASTLRFSRLLHNLESSFGLPIYTNDSESVQRIFAVHAPLLECRLGMLNKPALVGLENKMVRTQTISLEERSSRGCRVLFDSLFGDVAPGPYVQLYYKAVLNNRVTPIDVKADGYVKNGKLEEKPYFIPLLNEESNFVMEQVNRVLCRVACIRLILLQDTGA